MSGAILVLVAALAVTSSRSGPPAIAAYAPQAAQQIKQAPLEQTSNVGGALGGEGELSTTTTTATTTTTPAAKGGSAGVTTTTEPVVERARVRRCVGTPPRQTEDPQSPPCVPFWQGDNGGATYAGVTKDAINIAIPTTNDRALADLQTYFNSRYEFYGRKLNLVKSKDNGSENTCADRQAQAVADITQLHIFAASGASNGNAGGCYHTALARNKVISAAMPELFSDAELDSYRPYLWQYTAGFDRQFRAMGELVCAHLAGQKATHVTDPLLAGKPRSYGVVLQNVIRDNEVSLQPLFDAMAKCGEKIAPEHVFRLSTTDSAGLDHPELAQTAVARLKQDGVTTVFMLGIVFVEQNIANAAENQQYWPEWIFGTYGGNDWPLGIHAFWTAQSEKRSIMGIAMAFPARPINLEAGFQAMHEVDPAATYAKDLSDVSEFILQYKCLLVLASGIQMAGPNLTPDTFERALQATTFPYPADDPTQSGNVGFKGDHSMTDDMAEYWWDDNAVSPIGYQSDGAKGTVCYVDKGKRVRLGALPKGNDPFLTGPCYPGPT